MAILTVKNKWSEPFVGMFDGQEYEVKDSLACIDYIARHLKRQSIIRDNPINAGSNEYQLAIVEDGDDLSPLAELPAEALDRSDMDEFRNVVIKKTGLRVAPQVKGSAGQNIR